jgi:hypothetical protein
MVGKAQKFHGARFELNSVWKKWIGGTPLQHLLYSPDLGPCILKNHHIGNRQPFRISEFQT